MNAAANDQTELQDDLEATRDAEVEEDTADSAQAAQGDGDDAQVVAAEPAPTLESLQAEIATQRRELADLRKGREDLEKRAAELGEQTRYYAQQFDKARQEFAAAKDRLTREQDRALKRELLKAVSGLLGVLDTLDKSLASVKGGAPVGPSFVEGVQMIHGQFEQSLSAMGLKRFDGVGEAFDPNRHQAVTTLNVLDPGQDNVVVHSVAAGALLGDEVVRPASVVVGKCLAVGSDHVN